MPLRSRSYRAARCRGARTRAGIARALDGRRAVVGDPDVVSEELEEPAHADRRIHVVVDDEDAGSGLSAAAGESAGIFAAGLAAGRWMVNRLPLPGPSLQAETLPPCISASFSTIVRPMPSPPSERAIDRSPWLNRTNISGSFSGGMPIPLSSTEIDDLIVHPLGREPDVPAALGVLGGVGEQVDHDLLDARRIGAKRQLSLEELGDQGVFSFCDERSHRFDGLLQDRAGIDELPFQADLPAGDPGDVEQVIDQPGELPRLTVDDVLREIDVLEVARHLEDRDGVADRSEGIAQFVGEHREELILAAVCLAEAPPRSA